MKNPASPRFHALLLALALAFAFGVTAPTQPALAAEAAPDLALEQLTEGAAETGLGLDTPMGLLFFVFVLAIFLGFELIAKVPSQLHTPLMSGSNAISGITIVGALLAAGKGDARMVTILGTLAVIAAMINVVGGYLVTDRMLGMFTHKKKGGGEG